MPNFQNRTLYHGDNLDFLRGMDSETVHLIATDPPFNKSRDFHATPDSLARGAQFQDRGRGMMICTTIGWIPCRMTIRGTCGKSSWRQRLPMGMTWRLSFAGWECVCLKCIGFCETTAQSMFTLTIPPTLGLSV